MRTGELSVHLRAKDYNERGVGARLSRTTSNAMEAMPLIRQMFNQVYEAGKEYRSTTVVLGRMESDRQRQFDLFDDRVRIERMRELGKVVDRINGHYGKHRIFLGTGLVLGGVELNERDQPCWRKLNLLKGETKRRRVQIPRLDLRV